jgi:hypothetical protein
MTAKDHMELYKHLNGAIVNRMHVSKMSDLQVRFITAFEAGCFGLDFLKVYAEAVDKEPGMSLEQLHAICLGHGIGYKMYDKDNETKQKSH